MSYNPDASIEAMVESTQGICAISHTPLDTDAIIKSAGDASAGAIVVFVGTTRNSFKGKVVTKLEYTAYSKLAIKTMQAIISKAHDAVVRNEHTPVPQSHYNSSLVKCVVYHRIGVVPVGEPSIVIAVSSPHRKEAFVACEYILEEVKEKVQIWKKEFYEGMDDSKAEWKANRA